MSWAAEFVRNAKPFAQDVPARDLGIGLVGDAFAAEGREYRRLGEPEPGRDSRGQRSRSVPQPPRVGGV